MICVSSIVSYLENVGMEFEFKGKEKFNIIEYSPVTELKANSITWIKNVSNFDFTRIEGIENVLIVCQNVDQKKDGVSFLCCENPKSVFFTILGEFFKQEELGNRIESSSMVLSRIIGKNVYIGHNCYIGRNVEIGDGVVIKNNVSIEGKVKVGFNTIIYSGAIIGSDGYGYFQDAEGRNKKVPHYGGIRIGSHVEIGANTCIDRGTLSDTVIGDNVKIDNLCHIAHNVIIEENVSVVALSMIAGSVKLKKNSYIAPCASIKNQLTIGQNSMVGLGAVVLKDVEDNVVVAGIPAKVLKKIGEN